METSKNILFLCVDNSGRTQMTESLFKKYSSSKFNVISTGIILSVHLNSLVVQMMNEIRTDVINQFSKILYNSMIKNSHKIINMVCTYKESCLSIFVKHVLDWSISDPKEKQIDEIQNVRDQIKNKTINLIYSIVEKS